MSNNTRLTPIGGVYSAMRDYFGESEVTMLSHTPHNAGAAVALGNTIIRVVYHPDQWVHTVDVMAEGERKRHIVKRFSEAIEIIDEIGAAL